MASLQEKANQMLSEKQSKLVAKNIKKNVTIFGVTGTLETSSSSLPNLPIEIPATFDYDKFLNTNVIRIPLPDEINHEDLNTYLAPYYKDSEEQETWIYCAGMWNNIAYAMYDDITYIELSLSSLSFPVVRLDVVITCDGYKPLESSILLNYKKYGYGLCELWCNDMNGTFLTHLVEPSMIQCIPDDENGGQRVVSIEKSLLYGETDVINIYATQGTYTVNVLDNEGTVIASGQTYITNDNLTSMSLNIPIKGFYIDCPIYIDTDAGWVNGIGTHTELKVKHNGELKETIDLGYTNRAVYKYDDEFTELEISTQGIGTGGNITVVSNPCYSDAIVLSLNGNSLVTCEISVDGEYLQDEEVLNNIGMVCKPSGDESTIIEPTYRKYYDYPAQQSKCVVVFELNEGAYNISYSSDLYEQQAWDISIDSNNSIMIIPANLITIK